MHVVIGLPASQAQLKLELGACGTPSPLCISYEVVHARRIPMDVDVDRRKGIGGLPRLAPLLKTLVQIQVVHRLDGCDAARLQHFLVAQALLLG